MPDEETATPTASAPATPGTPGGPLFTSMRVDSLSYDRKSMPRCKCFPVTAPTWGQPHTCFTDFPAPDVSLTRKGSFKEDGFEITGETPTASFGLPTKRTDNNIVVFIVRTHDNRRRNDGFDSGLPALCSFRQTVFLEHYLIKAHTKTYASLLIFSFHSLVFTQRC